MINYSPSDDRNFPTAKATTKPTATQETTTTPMSHAELEAEFWEAWKQAMELVQPKPKTNYLDIVGKCAIVFLLIDIPLLALVWISFLSTKPVVMPSNSDKPAVCRVL